MTGVKTKQKRSDLDVYFESKRFRMRLDEIRALGKPLHYYPLYAMRIVIKLKLPPEHQEVILHYLCTGEYRPQASISPILVLDRRQQLIPTEDNPRQSYKFFESSQKVLRQGVAMELNSDTRKEELMSFIDENWSIIKKSLNINYPKRTKRFTPVRRIDDWLAIADTLNRIKDRHKRAKRAIDLAVMYSKNSPKAKELHTTDVYKIAKKYKTIY